MRDARELPAAYAFVCVQPPHRLRRAHILQVMLQRLNIVPSAAPPDQRDVLRPTEQLGHTARAQRRWDEAVSVARAEAELLEDSVERLTKQASSGVLAVTAGEEEIIWSEVCEVSLQNLDQQNRSIQECQKKQRL